MTLMFAKLYEVTKVIRRSDSAIGGKLVKWDNAFSYFGNLFHGLNKYEAQKATNPLWVGCLFTNKL